jgi:hypothetical protein
MKYQAVMNQLPRLLKADDAEDYVGGETMLRKLEVKPVHQGNRLTVYDRHELDAAIEKLKAERAA